MTDQLIGEAALPDSRLAGQQIETAATREAIVEPGKESAEFALPADEAATGPGRRRIGSRGHGIERGILAKDRLLELAQLPSRLDPELLDQCPPRRAVDVERLRLTTRAIQGEHELAARPLAQRMVGHQALELADHLRMPSEAQLGLDSVLARREPKLLQASDLGLDRPLIGEIRQRRTPPDVEGRLELVGRLLEIAGVRRGPSAVDGLLETAQVELPVFDLKLIARRAGHQNAPGAPPTLGLEQVAQRGDVHLQGFLRGLGRCVTPQGLDQPVAGDGLVRVDEQDPEEQTRLGTGGGQAVPTSTDLQWPEDSELDRFAGRSRLRSCRAPYRDLTGIWAAARIVGIDSRSIRSKGMTCPGSPIGARGCAC
jgi:hypothetical protein